ncbi:DUF1127 domain-containing protein [Paracraurococcus lichenis]|uniref:DUF1127 domain-containing protein n=1 Tax=Paracraurococcus lichenis TaxID=3064888 RepID=A0ABT9DSX0_9PROT|nr:DUF1127 domain-containing protein [Paracraurococcus sp. LOR1-02]MDO9706999.1 DUF1127 domain-containing protein [Paracraurococcus sp. LOR1-02]
MDARLSAAEASYLLPAATNAQQERAQALRLEAAEAHQAQLAQAGRRMLARLGDTVFGWVARARIRAELNSLSDRELADIGLSRGDIEHVLHRQGSQAA